MTDRDEKPMVVRVLINGEKQLSLTMQQDDPNGSNWYSAFEDLGAARLHVLVCGKEDGTGTQVHFDLSVREEVEEGEEVNTAYHEISGKSPVNGPRDWKSLTWRKELPVRANFPGEPPLPRTTLEVTLELEEALVPAS